MNTYTVQPGDSLSKIARDKLGDMQLWKYIAMLNNIRDVNLIYPGQVLKLPEIQSVVPQQTKVQTASVGGWLVGGFALLLLAGTIREKRKKKAHV